MLKRESMVINEEIALICLRSSEKEIGITGKMKN